MEKSKDRENRFRGKGTRKHKAETQKTHFFTFTRSILRDAKRRSNWEQIYPASCRGCTIVHSSSKID